jgi:hypothetical protein
MLKATNVIGPLMDLSHTALQEVPGGKAIRDVLIPFTHELVWMQTSLLMMFGALEDLTNNKVVNLKELQQQVNAEIEDLKARRARTERYVRQSRLKEYEG